MATEPQPGGYWVNEGDRAYLALVEEPDLGEDAVPGAMETWVQWLDYLHPDGGRYRRLAELHSERLRWQPIAPHVGPMG